jgi:SPP1 family predicted phage head-tail adaptor
VRAGNLRRRARLERRQVVRDGFGAFGASWAEFARVWAGVEPVGGREYFQAQSVQSDVTMRIRIRWRGDVAGMVEPSTIRVRVEERDGGTKIYEVESVIDVGGRGRELELMCRSSG